MRYLRTIVAVGSLLAMSAQATSAHCVSDHVWLVSQNVCVYCDQTRAFLQRSGIPFIEYNIDSSRQIWQNVQARYGWLATPIIDIDGVVIRGFNLLELQRNTCSSN